MLAHIFFVCVMDASNFTCAQVIGIEGQLDRRMSRSHRGQIQEGTVNDP